MEKAGRRPLLLFPMCGMVVSFIVLTVCLNLLNNPDYEVSVLKIYQNSCNSWIVIYAVPCEAQSLGKCGQGRPKQPAHP